MLYEANHTTRYIYGEPVAQCVSEARLIPRSSPGQRVLASRVQVQPEPAIIEERTDYFGNHVTSMSIFRRHDRFVTTGTSIIEVTPPVWDETPSMPWEEVRDYVRRGPDSASLEAYEYTFDSPFVAAHRELADFARRSFTPGRPMADAVLDLCHRIHFDFTYLPKSTTIDMPLLKVFRNRCGVCQDFSHIMIGAMRSLRLPARYVSGYLRSGANFQGAEASHAWVSAYVPGAGWLNFDPTNDLTPTDGHVTVAWGRDYGDVTPVKGIALGGGNQTVEVAVSVRPFDNAGPPLA